MDEGEFAKRALKRTWIDVGIGVGALAVSAISMIVAFETADANKKLVEASTWPFLQIESSNTDDQNHFRIALAVSNSGVGPAKLETFEVFWHGRAYRSSFDLLRDCCKLAPPNTLPGSGAKASGPSTGIISNVVIRAGETRFFYSLPLEDQVDAWHKFDHVRLFELKYRACYCSVFDDCWTSDLVSLHPTPVTSCPVPAVAYRE